MSVAQETPVEAKPPQPAPPLRNGRWSGYSHLLMARMLELKREPEVVFWVFVFPLLLALGLGIAFRNKPGDAVSVAIVRAPSSQDAQSLLARSPQHERFKVQVLDAQSAQKGFRLGKFDLVIEPDGKGGFAYRYDPARPESVLAKTETNEALQAAAGRKDVIATSVVTSSEPGSRYIDFLDSRPARHEPNELRHVGHRLRAGRHAAAQAAEAFRRHTHAPRRLSDGTGLEPPDPYDY